MLSTKKGKEAYVEPVIEGRGYRFTVKVGAPPDPAVAKAGTKLSRGANFRCVMSGAPIAGDYIKAEGKAGRMGARLMAVVAEGDRGRVYLAPTLEHEEVARQAKPEWRPNTEIPPDRRAMFTPLYGLTHFGDLFTPRQLVALTTFSDLAQQARKQVHRDAVAVGHTGNTARLHDGGTDAAAYADAVVVYLAFAIDRCCDFSNSCTQWIPSNQKVMHLFGKQVIAMTWDFSEAAVLREVVGGLVPAAAFIAKCLGKLTQQGKGVALQ